METLFNSLDMFDHVKNTFEEPNDIEKYTNEKMDDLKKKGAQNIAVLIMIQPGIAPTIFSKVMSLKIAKESSDVLKQEFQGEVKLRAIKLQTLTRDYKNTKMKKNEPLKDYSSRLTLNHIKSYDDKIKDQRIKVVEDEEVL
ncbi:hypothetical protein Tco_0794333 [Tanacetum coccineum]